MKTIISYLLLLAVVTSCNKSGDEADAFGNFETEEHTVSAESSGKLILFNLEEGQQLKVGALVAIVDTTQIYLRKKQMEAGISAIRKKLPNEAVQLAVFSERIAKLNSEIVRMKALIKANASPTKALDDLQSELAVAQRQKNATASNLSTQTMGMLAEIEPLRYQLLQIEDQLQKCYIRNPIDGTVLTTLANEGELTMQGRALYKVASLNPIVLRAYVSENMLSLVNIGDTVRVNTDGPDGDLISHTGKVTWISSEAEFTPKIIQTRDERTTQVYAIKITVTNNGQLKIGMPAEVQFGVKERTSDIQ